MRVLIESKIRSVNVYNARVYENGLKSVTMWIADKIMVCGISGSEHVYL